MSFSAGSICMFNCCQNGRDLPEDNSFVKIDNNGKKIYSCGCSPHYFLIISTQENNSKIHYDWSKMLSVDERDRKREIKLCTAIPIDIKDFETENKNPLLCFLDENEYVEATPRTAEELKKLQKNTNALICSKIARLNISSAKGNDTIGFISPDSLERILKSIETLIKKAKKEAEINIQQFKI